MSEQVSLNQKHSFDKHEYYDLKLEQSYEEQVLFLEFQVQWKPKVQREDEFKFSQFWLWVVHVLFDHEHQYGCNLHSFWLSSVQSQCYE